MNPSRPVRLSASVDRPITLKSFMEWLPIILICISLVTGWVAMGYQIKETNIALGNLRKEYDLHMIDVAAQKVERDKQYTAIQVTLAEIQRDIMYIRQELESSGN